MTDPPRPRRRLGSLYPWPAGLGVALFLSFVFHCQAVVGLTLLKLWEKEHEPVPEASGEPVSVEVRYSDEEPEEPSSESPTQDRRRARTEATEDNSEPVREVEVAAAAAPAPVPPTDARNRTVVEQRSRNPEAEAPPDARFLAQENSRVEEETVAEVTNSHVDQAQPELGAMLERSERPEEGNADEDTPADLREAEGSDARTVTPDEAQAERPRESDERPPPVAAREQNPAVREGGGGGGTGDEGGRAPEAGGGEERYLTIDDGHGTFRVARQGGDGRGPGQGTPSPGRGRGDRGAGTGRRLGDGRLRALGIGRGEGPPGPDLRLSWSTLRDVYGEETLRREREARLEERRSRRRGSSQAREWREFRAAIENYVPNVRPGNQTALNAAASPFANYIAGVHRRIHREFAHGFLRRLPGGATSPFADRTLNSKLEIILNRDGTVHRVGVVKPSGFLLFDQGAFRSVMRGQPYPEPPASILSGDGRVYIHWGFYRNERQCGTFNAEPYILPNPPGGSRRSGPLSDDLSPGGLVPAGSQPTWGQ